MNAGGMWFRFFFLRHTPSSSRKKRNQTQKKVNRAYGQRNTRNMNEIRTLALPNV
jgi:hypothetical protein